jgi:hypothetical protein
MLDELEAAFSAGDEELTELIAVSLLENLPQRAAAAGGVRALGATTEV